MKKSELYLNHLVPAAQMLELLQLAFRVLVNTSSHHQAVPHYSGKRSAREILELALGEAFDALNIVNAALQTEYRAHLPVTLAEQLASALASARLRWVTLYNTWCKLAGKTPAKFTEMLLSSHCTRGHYLAYAEQRKAVNTLVEELRDQKEALARLRFLVGFSAADRQVWLDARLGQSTVLLPNRKIGYWRTLACNGSWAILLEALKANTALSVVTVGSRTGRERYATFVKEAFSDSGVSSHHCLSKQPKLVPDTVQVTRLPTGLLLVKAAVEFSVKAIAPKDLSSWAAFCAEARDGVPSTRTVEVTCGADTLVEALAKVKEEAERVSCEDAKLLADFRAYQDLEKRRNALLKLKKTFSPEEIKELAAYFSTQQG